MIVLKAGKNNFWIFFLLCHHFTYWDVCAIYLVVMGTKAGEINFKYFFHSMLNRKKLPPEPRSCQKVRKSIFEYCFNSMLLRNKMPPKQRSCQKLKNSIFECFPNWILNRKKLRQNQDRSKRWRNQFLNTFLLQFWYIYIYKYPFSAHMKRATKRSRKVSVPPLLRKANVKFHMLRCLWHLSSRHGNKSQRNQFWILF